MWGLNGVCVTFLSPPSARRATTTKPKRPEGRHRISIPALREEGDAAAPGVEPPLHHISIPALREEGDVGTSPQYMSYILFLSPPSARRATDVACVNANSQTLFLSPPSARRATDDRSFLCGITGNFYPRPPRGGRQQKQRQNLYFQTNYTTFCTNLEEP